MEIEFYRDEAGIAPVKVFWTRRNTHETKNDALNTGASRNGNFLTYAIVRSVRGRHF